MKNIRKTKKNQVRKRKLSILRGGERNNNNLKETLRQKLGNRVKASDTWDTTNNNNIGKDWEWRIGDKPKFKVKRLKKDEDVTTDKQFLIPFKKNNKNNKYIIYEQKEGDKWVEVKPYKEAS